MSYLVSNNITLDEFIIKTMQFLSVKIYRLFACVQHIALSYWVITYYTKMAPCLYL